MTKHIVIGTAGHIDHGKTALIHALTGIDTDRLVEEKARGITIDLGFAHMTFPDGTFASIIDVPGHEKFIKNMLAGAGALDIVLMTVAADEGVMPQTREHLAILSLLGLSRGIVVLTKCDIADAETLELAKEDVTSAFAGTFLEHAPLLCVSSRTGEGIHALKKELEKISSQIVAHTAGKPLRIPIDRVFTVKGFGTVVTGTVTEGRLCVGDTVTVSPLGVEARVRGMQAGGVSVCEAAAGQRAAVNLIGIKKEQIMRGGALSVLRDASACMDVKLTVLEDAAHGIVHGTRLHLAIGTACVVCRLCLLGTDALAQGESGFAQLRLESPVAVRCGDRFVVRFYSPLETIGGGTVLDTAPRRHKRLDRQVIKRLQLYDTGSLQDQMLYETLMDAVSAVDMRKRFAHIADAEFYAVLSQLKTGGRLIQIKNLILSPDFLSAETERLKTTLQAYHAAHPLDDGMPAASLQNCFTSGLPEHFIREGIMRWTANTYALAEFSPFDTPLYQEVSLAVKGLYEQSLFAPPIDEEVIGGLSYPSETTKRVLMLMTDRRQLVRIAPEMLLLQQHYDTAVELFTRLAESGCVTLAQFRDRLGTSRKYAIALLEHFDAVGFTQKDGDARILA